MEKKGWVQLGAVLLIVVFLLGQMTMTKFYVSAAVKRNLNVKNVTLSVGMSKQLKVSGLKTKSVKWSSSKKSVVSVSKKGKITAKKKGKAVIFAKYSGGRLKCKVTVNAQRKSKLSKTTTSETTTESVSTPTQNSAQTVPVQNGKILVAYFSWSGTSEKIAKNIIQQTGADSFRIERVVPYSSDYQTTAYGDAKTEAQINARPAIKDPLASVAQYDKIILCYPIWWHTAPMTVGTFLENYDFTGKKIYPVSQSASMDRSQYEESVAFISGCAKGATIDNGIFSKDDTAIQKYVDQIVRE